LNGRPGCTVAATGPRSRAEQRNQHSSDPHEEVKD
jgi:hypothetical protein